MLDSVMLFHVSETPDIPCFEPRLADGDTEPLVWAIGAARLHNYILPRNCPRVTYCTGPTTTAEDAARFLGDSAAVIAIEHDWYERVRDARLYCYTLNSTTFECINEGAGYFVSRLPVTPSDVQVFGDPIKELLGRGIELRLVPSLWTLHDAVAASTLQFSMIRMRNARARTMTEPHQLLRNHTGEGS